LYCSPKAAGAALPKRLYEELELRRVIRGYAAIHVEASEPAEALLSEARFDLVARTISKLNGVSIHNFTMTKLLT